MKINQHYLDVKDSYLFSTISKRVHTYQKEHPDAHILSLGIGDVTRPLAPVITQAMQAAVEEMKHAKTFRGYGEEQGYAFLREAIVSYYQQKHVTLQSDEIFISDGAKSDLGNILDIFDTDNTVLIPDPVYPVYVDTNIMTGRSITYLQGNKENGFLPMPSDDTKGDIVYLCSPNNPTGALYNKGQLQKWVQWANTNHAIILFDSAYEAFIGDDNYPSSIYEIEGAKNCAIEFCSLSKTAGFTGVRCGYTVIPHALTCGQVSLHSLWLRRQTTKFNGVSYIVQRGAQAVFSPQGLEQIHNDIAYYKENARIMAQTFDQLHIWYIGGTHSPYLWLACPKGVPSWTFFDTLLQEYQIVGTPGVGFGKQGEGYFRLSSFGKREDIEEAMSRLRNLPSFI